MIYELKESVARGGICEYETVDEDERRLPKAKNPKLLRSALRAKDDLVAEAQTAKDNRDPWDDEDFKELLRSALETVLGPMIHEKRLNS